MPRNVIELPFTEIGMVCNTEARDLAEQAVITESMPGKQVLKRPEHYAVYSKNVDPMSPLGRVQAITGMAQPASAPDINNIDGLTITKAKMLEYTSSGTKYALLADDGADIEYVLDFYGTTGTPSTDFINSTRMKCAEVENGKMHIGTGNASTNYPKFVGWKYHQTFAADHGKGDIFNADAACARLDGNTSGTFGITVTGTATAASLKTEDYAVFEAKDRPIYFFTYVYDFLQESPFMDFASSPTVDQGFSYLDNVSGKVDAGMILTGYYIPSISVKIIAYGAKTSPTSFPKRLTAIKLYRRIKDDEVPKLLVTIDCTVLSNVFQTADWVDESTNDKAITLVDYVERISDGAGNFYYPSYATYEEETGISHLVASHIVNYSIATQINNSMFVSSAYQADLIEDSYQMVFKSKPG